MATPIKLTNREILSVRDGLRALDGIVSKETTVRFDFDTQTSWNITKNLVAIEKAVVLYEKQGMKFMKELGLANGEKVTAENALRVGDWNIKTDELKDVEQEFTSLLRLPKSVLMKAGVGKFPVVMANLFPIISELE